MAVAAEVRTGQVPKTLRGVLSYQGSGGPRRTDNHRCLFVTVLLRHVLDTDAIVGSTGQEGKLELLTLGLEEWEGGGAKKPENTSEIIEKRELRRVIPQSCTGLLGSPPSCT